MGRLDRYPALRRMLLEVEYDNGGINRGRTEEQALGQAEETFFADHVVEADVAALDRWLAELSEEDFHALAAGEHSDMDAVRLRAPSGAEGHPVANLIDDWFEGWL